MMSKNHFIQLPEFGHILISGPLFDWLTEQRSIEVALPWSSIQEDSSPLTTRPLQHLNWKLILFFDQAKRAKQGWRLEPDGHLPNQEALRFIEETFQ